MVNSRNLETVVSQKQYFQNPVVVLVFGSREPTHEALDVINLERMQEVTFVLRDPKEPEERGRNTHVTAPKRMLQTLLRTLVLLDRGSHQDVVERPEEEMQRITVDHLAQRACDGPNAESVLSIDGDGQGCATEARTMKGFVEESWARNQNNGTTHDTLRLVANITRCLQRMEATWEDAFTSSGSLNMT